MSGAQQQPGPAFPVISFDSFKTLNTEVARPAIKDDEFSWGDNFMPIGDTELRTLWDKGAPIFTAPSGTTIGYYAAFNINLDPYLVIFPTDGSIWVVNTNTLVTNNIATAGTVTATLSSLSVNGAVVGLSLGTWNGTSCQIIIANDSAAVGGTATGAAQTTGNFCARVYDVGKLTAPTDYVITVQHY